MTTATVIRSTKRSRIYNLFHENVGSKFGSSHLHDTFGTSFRTRVSEINRDPKSAIRILNETRVQGDSEASWYWAEIRKNTPCLPLAPSQ